MKKTCILVLFIWYMLNCSAQLNLNTKCQAILSNPETGLVATSDSLTYTYAVRNTTAITTALSRLSKGQDLLLPEGIYDVETILLPTTLKRCIISGSGTNKTILRRKGFSWDNNTQGDCPLRTEVIFGQNLLDFQLTNIVIDGNCEHIQISGYGTWNLSNGTYTNGTPQFPTFISNDAYRNSGGGVVSIALSDSISFDNVFFKNGYRWCVMIGKVNGFHMINSTIDTGNLSTEFKGHLDPAPNNIVMHMHTSQDGLHMVNVSNAIIEFNDIHSEDSAIAIELNPLWTWGGYDSTTNVIIRNNYVSTASPTNPTKLMNDEDIIYGTGLANKWVGQSAVDIFYNETWDTNGSITMGGSNGSFKNIQIYQNAFEAVRQGVRCGFFLGAGTNNAENIHHRVYNLQIRDNQPPYMAGKDRNKLAGIRNVTKNEIPTSWNLTGGAGIAIRHTDSVLVSNNLIENVKGGIGVNLQDVILFSVLNNTIDSIFGTQLASNWTGGEGIRIYNNRDFTNDPQKGQYNAGYFLISGNKIGLITTNKIAIINTQNGTLKLNENYDLNNNNFCRLNTPVNFQNSEKIDLGDCSGSGVQTMCDNSKFNVFPILTQNQIHIVSKLSNINVKYTLFNYVGVEICSIQTSQNDITISVEKLPCNIYFLSISNFPEPRTIIKIIKV